MRYLIPCLALPLMACTPSAMLMTNPNAALDLMAGTGTVARSPSGQTTFRFALPENAYAGLISDPEQHLAQEQQALAQWIGREAVCPSGYTVNPPISTSVHSATEATRTLGPAVGGFTTPTHFPPLPDRDPCPPWCHP